MLLDESIDPSFNPVVKDRLSLNQSVREERLGNRFFTIASNQRISIDDDAASPLKSKVRGLYVMKFSSLACYTLPPRKLSTVMDGRVKI